jgi:hypothetical protein
MEVIFQAASINTRHHFAVSTCSILAHFSARLTSRLEMNHRFTQYRPPPIVSSRASSVERIKRNSPFRL